VVALVIAAIGFLLAAGLQNIPPAIELVKPAPEASTPTAEDVDVPPPAETDQLAIMGRLYVKLGDFVAADPTAIPTLERQARTPADRVRVAIIAGEVLGAEAAIERLGSLEEQFDDASALHRDAELLRRVYEQGPGVLASHERERLRDHHGYFGEVALTHPLAESNPERRDLREGGVVLAAVLLGVAVLFGGGLLAGFGLFITAIVLLSLGKLRRRMPVPQPGGSVYLEVFALFVAGFLVLQMLGVGLAMIGGRDAMWPRYVSVGSQWLLLAVPAWPLVRGLSWPALSRGIGWHRGRGFFREVGFGVLGYLAGLPLFVVGVVISLVLMALVQLIRQAAGLGEAPTPDNPVIELLTGGNVVFLVLVVSLATVWAPLCEELVFRGALQRHLRAGMSVVGAGLVTATLFGFLHGYGPLLVFPLIALGFVFSMLREWRGSLIAPITAHALHNGVLITVVIILLRGLG